jgi:putative ubiquitin-RnfH superfamily antitoxin RatB of RatAB toxin-antitoxin module
MGKFDCLRSLFKVYLHFTPRRGTKVERIVESDALKANNSGLFACQLSSSCLDVQSCVFQQAKIGVVHCVVHIIAKTEAVNKVNVLSWVTLSPNSLRRRAASRREKVD